MVLSSDICTNDGEIRELAEDLLAIITVFVVQNNGLCSATNRRRRRDAAQEIQEFKKEVKKLLAGKVQRIRIYPNQQERLKLRRWMGTAR